MEDSSAIDEFLKEVIEDCNSPITSTFVSKIPQIKQTIDFLDEGLEADLEVFHKLQKAIKSCCNSGKAHVENKLRLSKYLDSLGNNVLDVDSESNIGVAIKKFAIVTKEWSILMKSLIQNIQNSLMVPVDILVKNDLSIIKHDIKRPFDKAYKDYETKYQKIEKEKKQHAKEVGLIRSEVIGAEIADEMEKERKYFQLQMCEYLIKYNELKNKKGNNFVYSLMDFFHAKTTYFQDGFKTIEYFFAYINDLGVQLKDIHKQVDEEMKKLIEVKTLIQNSLCFEKDISITKIGTNEKNSGYSLHQPSGDKELGITRSGYLLKKCDRKMVKAWQRRLCLIRPDGILEIHHADKSKSPNRVNIITCQIKLLPDDKKSFDLVSSGKTYHFQAEDEFDHYLWVSVLTNCKNTALKKIFEENSKKSENRNLIDFHRSIILVIVKLPGNYKCCDCDSTKDVSWISTNLGIIVCIECSGIHRYLGVHVSRIQSYILDNLTTSQLLLARFVGNQMFNEIMEKTLSKDMKLKALSTMEERHNFVKAKYIEKRFVSKISDNTMDLLIYLEKAILEKNFSNLLQIYAHNVDMSLPLPKYKNKETALHLAVKTEDGTSLHIVDFLIQNFPPNAIDKKTDSSFNSNDGLNTALHLSAQYNHSECTKLLLLHGADLNLRNAQNKTPLDIAYELNHYKCIDLLEKAEHGYTKSFDNININWNLLKPDDEYDDFYDDIDFSEDDTDEILKLCSPEPCPSSEIGNKSPLSIRSKSSTCDNLNSNLYLSNNDPLEDNIKEPTNLMNSEKQAPAPLSPIIISKFSSNSLPLPLFRPRITPRTRFPLRKTSLLDLKGQSQLPKVTEQELLSPNKQFIHPPLEEPLRKSNHLSDNSYPIPPPRKINLYVFLTLKISSKNNL